MPQQILALELDAHEMKAAVIETTFRDYRVAGFYRDPVTADGGSLADQVRAFLERHQLKGSTVLSSLPGDLVSQRSFYLPFRDRKRLDQTVPFELEAQVPFSLDDVVIDYDVLSNDRTGSNVLAALVQRPDLEAHLTLMDEVGLDPKVVDSAPLATLNILGLLGNDLPATFAYIGSDARRTTVALYRNRHLVGLRTLLPAALAAAADGEVAANGNGHAPDTSPGVEALVNDIRWTLLAMNGAPLDDQLPCLLAGEGVEFDRIAARLGAVLGCEVRRLDQAPLRTVPQALRAELGGFVSPLGLALREVNADGALGVNFRQGTFAYHRGQDDLRRALWRSGALVVLVGVLMIANMYMGYEQLARRLQLVEGQIRNVFTETLPDVHRVFDEKAQLQSEIAEAKKKLQAMGDVASSGTTAVDVLRAMASALPPELKIDIDDYVMDFDGIKAKAKSESFESVDAIKQQIASTHAFGDVQVKDVKAAADGKGVDFRLVIALNKEAAGGAQKAAGPGGAGAGRQNPAAGAPPAGQK
jgi:general secretion pathway protein L